MSLPAGVMDELELKQFQLIHDTSGSDLSEYY
jgi:hypothetical protein